MNAQDFIGRTDIRTDVVCSHLLHRLAATLDMPEPEIVPPLWHWTLFQDWPRPAGIGTDGHPRRGGFIPPLADLSRRMHAGSRITFLGVLRVGEPVTRRSTIAAVTEKNGRTGRLVFITIRHEISGTSGKAIEEEQDLAYLGPRDPSARAAGPAAPPPEMATRRELVPDPLLLFRYSSLTGNCHRIHYDLEYATRDEGYPGLVVHGPLQATLLAGLAQRIAPDKLSAFSFRAHRPAFHGRQLTLEGWRDGPEIVMRSLDDTGALCVSARASVRERPEWLS